MINRNISFWEDYESLRKDITVDTIPGAKRVLEDLISQGKEVGIITNNSCSKTRGKLQSAKINSSMFDGNIYSCSENNCLKPSAEIIKYLKVNPENILYVGDDVKDYDFSRNARMGFYGVCTGISSEEDFIRRGLIGSRIFPSVKEII